MTLKIWNKESGQFRTILGQDHLFAMGENDQYFTWSPDNKWLIFDYSLPGSAVGEIGLVAAVNASGAKGTGNAVITTGVRVLDWHEPDAASAK